MKQVIMAIGLLLLCSFGVSHPGGLDANGGHNDRKNGGYHYHRGNGASRSSTASTAPRLPVASIAPAPKPVQAVQASTTQLVCTKVVDGDTIKLSNGETVRLIGVDTPETVHRNKPVEHFGKEASAFTKSIVEGKPVRLEYDQDTRDRYQRLLAYVHLMDGRWVNEMIVINGYGHAYTNYPFKRMELFREYERQAREAKRGLWADEAASVAVVTPTQQQAIAGMVYVTPSGAKYHNSTCKFASTGSPVSLQNAESRGLQPCKVCH